MFAGLRCFAPLCGEGLVAVVVGRAVCTVHVTGRVDHVTAKARWPTWLLYVSDLCGTLGLCTYNRQGARTVAREMGGGQSTEIPGGGSEAYHVLKVTEWQPNAFQTFKL